MSNTIFNSVENYVESGHLTRGEADILVPILDILVINIDEYDEIFGGYSNLELYEVTDDINTGRGHLGSLVKKGWVRVNETEVNGDYFDFIYLTNKSFEFLENLGY